MESTVKKNTIETLLRENNVKLKDWSLVTALDAFMYHGEIQPFISYIVDPIVFLRRTLFVTTFEPDTHTADEEAHIVGGLLDPFLLDPRSHIYKLYVDALVHEQLSLFTFHNVLICGELGLPSRIVQLHKEAEDLMRLKTKRQFKSFMMQAMSKSLTTSQAEQDAEAKQEYKKWVDKMTESTRTYNETYMTNWLHHSDPIPLNQNTLDYVVYLFYCTVIPAFDQDDRIVIMLIGTDDVIFQRDRIPLDPYKIFVEEKELVDDEVFFTHFSTLDALYNLFLCKQMFPALYARTDSEALALRTRLELACRIMGVILYVAGNATLNEKIMPSAFHMLILGGILVCKQLGLERIAVTETISSLQEDEEPAKKSKKKKKRKSKGSGPSKMEEKQIEVQVVEQEEEKQVVTPPRSPPPRSPPRSPPRTPPRTPIRLSRQSSGGGVPSNWSLFRVGSAGITMKYDPALNACLPRDSSTDAKSCYDLYNSYKNEQMEPDDEINARVTFAQKCVAKECWDKGHCGIMRQLVSPSTPSSLVEKIDAYCSTATANETEYGPYYSPHNANRSPQALGAMYNNASLLDARFSPTKKKDRQRRSKLTQLYREYAEAVTEPTYEVDKVKLINLLSSSPQRQKSP